MTIIMTESGEIAKLAEILHQNGDKVLNGLSKLSLNATLLQKINKEFDLFLENENDNGRNKFHVISSGNTNSQFMQDLHFLHDFIQKTIGVKITNSTNLSLLNNKVDLSKFKNLQYLEIKKVSVKELIGLKLIQSQLESIVCIKCMSKLEELLAECGGDESNGFVWSELKELVISYNSIKVLDTSIAFAPWLEVLDLSHNQITNVKPIECLPNLKYINLSFNCLNSVPTFSKAARKKLLVLVAKSNYIEDISGLTGLDHLVELDLSWNWISNYECLQPLLTMSALQNLSLKGNPISYHKNYKHCIVGYLHISASLSDFVLDGIKLSKSEKAIVGYKLYQPHRPSTSVFVTDVCSPIIQNPACDVRSSDKCNNGKKSSKAKLAVIPNIDDGTYEEIPADMRDTFKESTSKEHLITKKKIEEARAIYGSDNWLRCEAGNVVQDLLGLPLSETLTSTPLDDFCLETALKAEESTIKTTAATENNSDVVNDTFITCDDDYSSNYYSLNNEENEQKEDTGMNSKKESESKETSPDFLPIHSSNEDFEDENEKIYLVSRIIKTGKEYHSEELFLSLTDSELKEKDTNRGSVTNKWSMSYLESCIRIQSNRLELTFDTVKRDKRERTYEMEESEAIEVHKLLCQILESRTLQDMNQVVYKCITCSSEFSKIINSRKVESKSRCPFCNSAFILEDDNSLEKEKRPGEEKKCRPMASYTRSSSSGIIQDFCNSANGKLVTGSCQSSTGSAASLDELNEHPAIQNINAKRSDSEIEILSNPSQSSIEVIDDSSRSLEINASDRKRSSGEKHFTQNLTLPENMSHISNIAGLTESSSSGSITDSVCTTYENNSYISVIQKPSNSESLKEEGKEIRNEKKTEAIYGFEEGKGNKNTKSSSKNPVFISNKIQYCYKDFTKADHRITLFLYSQIFESDSEYFCFLLRCYVLSSNSAKSYPSCVVCSNKKLYVLKVIGSEEGDNPSVFLKKSKSLRLNLNLIKSIDVLTWHQGFSVKLHEPHDKLKEFLILLKDRRRTQSFLTFLRAPNLNLPNTWKIVAETSEVPILLMQHLLVSGASEDSNIHYYCLLSSCLVINHPDVREIESGSILTTNADILLFSSEPKWLFEGSDQPPQPVFVQKMSNLMSIETCDSQIYLNFTNENERKEEIWHLNMETADEVNYLIQAVKSPWEEMFAIPLLVSNISKYD